MKEGKQLSEYDLENKSSQLLGDTLSNEQGGLPWAFEKRLASLHKGQPILYCICLLTLYFD